MIETAALCTQPRGEVTVYCPVTPARRPDSVSHFSAPDELATIASAPSVVSAQWSYFVPEAIGRFEAPGGITDDTDAIFSFPGQPDDSAARAVTRFSA
jgi:hypothetical protein